MNTWKKIRRATEEDYERLAVAIVRFIDRHHIFAGNDLLLGVECALIVFAGMDEEARDHAERLARLWTGVVRRALRCKEADGIVGGYVGREG